MGKRSGKPSKIDEKSSQDLVPDYTDDWMHPKPYTGWTYKAPENKVEYLIQRQRRVPVTGNVAYITQWDTWGIPFDTEEERDEEYDRLKKQYPMWILRKHKRNPYFERLIARF